MNSGQNISDHFVGVNKMIPINKEGELDGNAVCWEFRRTGYDSKEAAMKKFWIPEFSTKPTNFYNSDVVIS